jgi:hypothetical protein
MHRSEQYSRLRELYEFQQKLVELRLCTTDGRSWHVELHQDSTLRDAVALARSAMPSSAALERADDDGIDDPYSEAGGGVEWRLRHFSPMTGRAGQTFDNNLLDSSLVRINSPKSKPLAYDGLLISIDISVATTGRYWTGTQR